MSGANKTNATWWETLRRPTQCLRPGYQATVSGRGLSGFADFPNFNRVTESSRNRLCYTSGDGYMSLFSKPASSWGPRGLGQKAKRSPRLLGCEAWTGIRLTGTGRAGPLISKPCLNGVSNFSFSQAITTLLFSVMISVAVVLGAFYQLWWCCVRLAVDISPRSTQLRMYASHPKGPDFGLLYLTYPSTGKYKEFINQNLVSPSSTSSVRRRLYVLRELNITSTGTFEGETYVSELSFCHHGNQRDQRDALS
ncbi:hypothetical protein SISNIDRAFT_469506 [Sistotremastrum niveocremeum HHB9708]|uniref:Uncharacterized protein n=1 Tax=Sistotremastrum niveocremeum HHB9708 TaxID=1314777 RepID=A0A164Q166_9AGAM|nr:hypothetical protein SISNIDRAFT_469506 [Sistotremastrum niveocremeum HHB9708]